MKKTKENQKLVEAKAKVYLFIEEERVKKTFLSILEKYDYGCVDEYLLENDFWLLLPEYTEEQRKYCKKKLTEKYGEGFFYSLSLEELENAINFCVEQWIEEEIERGNEYYIKRKSKLSSEDVEDIHRLDLKILFDDYRSSKLRNQ